MKCARGHDWDDCPCVEEEAEYWSTRQTIVFVAVFLLIVLVIVMGGWRIG